ncbi:MAG: ORF6N domain-containing protein [Candidatus Thermoplasmatota archaeon]|nr:ORF6N domain-containing protein [Candidatus Thermoplasmatota archaeon]MBU4072125.1 ORF6N domain-containing protein [Candidatus Thermoplasmatota archaeon]MBU4143541.1 ORF6N domain-containing protein [Candidatus Thermoplasmatota archaeon]MBU4591954.1 ORF6N domain-containing protein [Candidatus Thermoplasmatota archaeon]
MEKPSITEPMINTEIQSRIHTIRGVQVMLDSDLAQLYGVEAKRLNEQVRAPHG